MLSVNLGMVKPSSVLRENIVKICDNKDSLRESFEN